MIDDDGDYAYDCAKDDALDRRLDDISNCCEKGRGWGGTGSRSMMVTYNGIKKPIDQWALHLGIAVGTLRAKVKKAVDGEITWDVAMLDAAGRVAYGNKCRAEKLAKHAEKANRVRDKNREKRKKAEEAKARGMEAFLYGNVYR